MARTTGVEITGSTVRVVEIDGSPKKFRITGAAEVPISESEDGDHYEALTQALRTAFKQAKARKDQVVLGFPARDAVIREILIPFTDADQIRKVIKFESEGHLHGVDIEDVVVDFEVIGTVGPRSRVLVVAVRKETLRHHLECLQKLGIDPHAVDLDATALFARARQIPAVQEEDEGGYAILDLGEQTSTLVVANGDKLRLIRSLRLGSETMARALSADLGIDRAEARTVTMQLLSEDVPFAAGSRERGSTSTALTSVGLKDTAVRDSGQIFAAKVVQEVRRSLSTVQMEGRLQGIYLTGPAARTAGMESALEEAFSARVRPLDVLHEVDHPTDPDPTTFAGAGIGLALKALGYDPVRLDFRQEDLIFTKKFEKIRAPLAFAGILLFAILALASVQQFHMLRAANARTKRCAEAAASIFDKWIVTPVREEPKYLTILGYPDEEHLSNEIRELTKVPEARRTTRYRVALDQRLEEISRRFGIELDGGADASGPEATVVSAMQRLTQFVTAMDRLRAVSKDQLFELRTLKVTADEITWNMHTKNPTAWTLLESYFRELADFKEAKRGKSEVDAEGWEKLTGNRLVFTTKER